MQTTNCSDANTRTIPV